METKLYRIKRGFAKHKKLPVYFAGIKLYETSKAVYIFGRGTTETKKIGRCCVCGRKLTHPVSIQLGIGPECGKHYWNWDQVGGYSEENVKRLSQLVQQDIKVDGWIPKSSIKKVKDTTNAINIPKDHKMLGKEKTKRTKVSEKVAKEFELKNKRAIKILFPFNRETLRQIKTIPGRKFHSKEKPKFWSAPLSIEAVEKLKEFGFKTDPSLDEYLDKNKVKIEDLDADINIPGLGGDLFPFQAKGVQFIDAKNGRALVADEMGLGKTVQALAWMQKYPEKRPAIIISPASLKINWEREARKWMDSPNTQILSGTKADDPITGDVLIINYDIIKEWGPVLKKINPKILVLDEVHYIKNNKAQRTKAVKKLAKGIPHVIPLTGTPIINRPAEIVNAVQLVDRSVIPNKWKFLHRYCDAKHNGFGWDFSGASNTKELHEKLTSSIMIRRLKKNVLKDLPDKIRSYVPIELDNQKEYQKAEDDFVSFVKEKTEKDVKSKLEQQLGDLADVITIDEDKLEEMKKKKASMVNVLTEIEGLKQLAVQGKMKSAISWIKDYLESGNKLVVMAVHKFVINQLMEEFGKDAVKIDGSVSGRDRDSAVERFQNDPKVKLLVGNIQAAGVGLTLTAAHAEVILELPWTPGELNQAEDRIHRIGQKESVTIYYLLAQNTIEEKIAKLIDQKRKILDSVLDGRESESGSLIAELMKSYKF